MLARDVGMRPGRRPESKRRRPISPVSAPNRASQGCLVGKGTLRGPKRVGVGFGGGRRPACPPVGGRQDSQGPTSFSPKPSATVLEDQRGIFFPWRMQKATEEPAMTQRRGAALVLPPLLRRDRGKFVLSSTRRARDGRAAGQSQDGHGYGGGQRDGAERRECAPSSGCPPARRRGPLHGDMQCMYRSNTSLPPSALCGIPVRMRCRVAHRGLAGRGTRHPARAYLPVECTRCCPVPYPALSTSRVPLRYS